MKKEGFGTSAMRILVAEDDSLAAEVLKAQGRRAGMIVETVANGLDAADRIANALPHYFDAVVLDMRMPIMDGREAAARIRDLPYSRGTLPIFAMSASASELFRHPWAAWLFDGHLMKPLDWNDLLALLRAHDRPASGRAAKPSVRDIGAMV